MRAVSVADAVANATRAGFESNTTVFGRILQGTLPAKIVFEDDRVLGFCDISPASATHCLVIPKRHIATARQLTPSDRALVEHMIAAANEIAVANGVASDRLLTKGYGSEKPMVDAQHPDADTINRRVEFKVLRE